MFYRSRGVWVASWYCDDGRRKTMRLPRAIDRETAQTEFQSRRVADPTVIAAQSPDSSIQTLISTFERQVMPGYRTATQAIYRQMFGLLTKAGIRTVSDFRPDKLRTLTDVLIAENMGPAQQHKMLRTTKRFMRWANEVGYLVMVPKVFLPRVRKRSRGRPLDEAEFQTMLASVDGVYHHHPDRAADCKRLMWGLWLGGLRLGEALSLSWDDEYGFHVDAQNHKRPVFVMPSDDDKTGEDRIFPMAPEFWELISQTPEEKRHGSVFRVRPTIGTGKQMSSDDLSDLLSEIGRNAKIIVGRRPENRDTTTVKLKYASAHDLRRSFGLIWAQRVNQMQLGALMRHRDPNTTAKYYLGVNAAALLDSVWQAGPVEPARSQSVSPPEANVEPVALRRPSVFEMPIPGEDDPVEQLKRQTHEPPQRNAKRVVSRSRRTGEPRDVVVERSLDFPGPTGPTMTGTTTTAPKLMRAKEACDLLGISRWTLIVLAKSKVVRTVKVSRQNRYLTADVMAMVDPNNERSVELISPIKAAQMFGGVSARTITRMADAGQLRFVVTPGGHRRVYLEDVTKLAASQGRRAAKAIG